MCPDFFKLVNALPNNGTFVIECLIVNCAFICVQVYNPPATGSVSQVLVRAELVLVRVPGLTDTEARMLYFTKEFMPQHINSKKTHSLLYIPDYCDYTAIHHYLSTERCIDFSSINEFMTRVSNLPPS